MNETARPFAAVRHIMSAQIESGAQRLLHASVHVSLGTRPALLDLATGHIPAVGLSTHGATVDQISGLDLTLVLHDVHLAHGDSSLGTLARSSATVLLTRPALESVLTTQIPAAASRSTSPHQP